MVAGADSLGLVWNLNTIHGLIRSGQNTPPSPLEIEDERRFLVTVESARPLLLVLNISEILEWVSDSILHSSLFDLLERVGCQIDRRQFLKSRSDVLRSIYILEKRFIYFTRENTNYLYSTYHFLAVFKAYVIDLNFKASVLEFASGLKVFYLSFELWSNSSIQASILEVHPHFGVLDHRDSRDVVKDLLYLGADRLVTQSLELGIPVPVVVVGSLVEYGNILNILWRLGDRLDAVENERKCEDGLIIKEVYGVPEHFPVHQELGIAGDVGPSSLGLVQVVSNLNQNVRDGSSESWGDWVLQLAEISKIVSFALAFRSIISGIGIVYPLAASLERGSSTAHERITAWILTASLVQEIVIQNSGSESLLLFRLVDGNFFQVLQESRQFLEVHLWSETRGISASQIVELGLQSLGGGR